MSQAEQTHTALLLMGCGGLSGIITKSSVAPLERVKLLYQVQGMHGTQRYSTLGGSLRLMMQEDGARGLFRGNGANILRILPAYSLKFMFNDTFKQAFQRPGQRARDMTFPQLLGAGMLAGLSQIALSYPLQLVRTRLMLDRAMGGSFRGMWHCVTTTVSKEGVTGLYRGYSVGLATTPVYVGLQMSLYDVFRGMLPATASGAQNVLECFAAGAMGGLIAQSVGYPGDTIKKQMQGDGIGKQKYANVRDCVRTVYRQGGLKAFYPGLTLNSIKCVPEAGLQFVAFDFFKRQAGL